MGVTAGHMQAVIEAIGRFCRRRRKKSGLSSPRLHRPVLLRGDPRRRKAHGDNEAVRMDRLI